MTAEGVVIPLRSPRTTASETNPFPLWNDPEFYSDSKADSRAFGTGHLKKECARGQILWIDEAGLLSAKQMRWAIDFASRNACRVILSGDNSTASLSRTGRCAADIGTRGRRKSDCLDEDIPATGPRAKGGDL